jgi:hypothetical protein
MGTGDRKWAKQLVPIKDFLSLKEPERGENLGWGGCCVLWGQGGCGQELAAAASMKSGPGWERGADWCLSFEERGSQGFVGLVLERQCDRLQVALGSNVVLLKQRGLGCLDHAAGGGSGPPRKRDGHCGKVVVSCVGEDVTS